MSTTDYQFNLDRIDKLITDKETNLSLIVPYVSLLKYIPLDVQDLVFLRRGMWSQLKKVVRTLQKLRDKQKLFIKLSTISAKDVKIDWDNTDIKIILSQFIQSERIVDDLNEAISRQASIGICVASWRTFNNEYRTFVTPVGSGSPVDSLNIITRDQYGETIISDIFEVIGTALQPHFTGPFVFDVGQSREHGLILIECNQYDDTTDMYEKIDVDVKI